LRSWSVIMGGPNAIWNFAGDRIYANINTIGRVQFLNYWGSSLRILYTARSDDDRLTRGGPMARSPGGWSGSANLNSDRRRALQGDVSFSWGSDDGGGWNRRVQLGLNARFQETLQVDVGPSYSWSLDAAQYVSKVADPFAESTYGTRYVFAGIDRSTLSLETRVNLTFSPTLSFELYLEPFISTGDYGALKELRAPGTFEFFEYGEDVGTVTTDGTSYAIDPDGEGPADAFQISNRDFSYRSLLGNAVLRWEWRPGSTLFLVWQQSRINSVAAGDYLGTPEPWVGDFEFGRDSGDMFQVAPDNILMIKVSYWLNP
jgi:hypothetical protein